MTASRIADLDLDNLDGPEYNTAVSLSDLEITPAAIAGGRSASLRVRLTSEAPASNNGVRLTSSNPEVLPVLSALGVPFGTTRATNIVPKVVAVPTPVDITATVRPRLQDRYLHRAAAGAVGILVDTDHGDRRVRYGDHQGDGERVRAVSLCQRPDRGIDRGGEVPVVDRDCRWHDEEDDQVTDYVTARQAGTVTASYGGVSRAITHTVRPIRGSISAPSPIAGGATVTGTVTLECKSPMPIVVSLSSSSNALASPVVPSITIPAGELSGSFGIKTADVSAVRTVSIYARVYRVRSSSSLTLNP